ncbi:metal ABC transporter ATP-binding protein [uncultured Brachyspira sp.]|uniref:metal ABC transporter ATP-binding protein n=1 Tax=uncultured Brachyspira sp. TaxID=221953 RepID=UPI00260D78D7|nr:metal ABC transporter ATP-binding protein [uncultured Brachyspira sp.]
MLNIKDLSVFYDSNEVLSNINFSLSKGDYLSIIGENGSGKTTLVKTILELMKPKKGSIEFDNIKKNEIGYLPQQGIIQKSFPASVFEVVISGRLNKKKFLPFYTSKDKKEALNNLKKFNIENLKNKSYKDLSGGQQQRVILARALCSAKELLILDEPSAGLDPIATIDLYNLIKKLNDEVTIIMVSHDIASAVKYSNKILHINKNMLFFGSTEDYIKTDIYKRISGEDME